MVRPVRARFATTVIEHSCVNVSGLSRVSRCCGQAMMRSARVVPKPSICRVTLFDPLRGHDFPSRQDSMTPSLWNYSTLLSPLAEAILFIAIPYPPGPKRYIMAAEEID